MGPRPRRPARSAAEHDLLVRDERQRSERLHRRFGDPEQPSGVHRQDRARHVRRLRRRNRHRGLQRSRHACRRHHRRHHVRGCQGCLADPGEGLRLQRQHDHLGGDRRARLDHLRPRGRRARCRQHEPRRPALRCTGCRRERSHRRRRDRRGRRRQRIIRLVHVQPVTGRGRDHGRCVAGRRWCRCVLQLRTVQRPVRAGLQHPVGVAHHRHRVHGAQRYVDGNAARRRGRGPAAARVPSGIARPSVGGPRCGGNTQRLDGNLRRGPEQAALPRGATWHVGTQRAVGARWCPRRSARRAGMAGAMVRRLAADRRLRRTDEGDRRSVVDVRRRDVSSDERDGHEPDQWHHVRLPCRSDQRGRHRRARRSGLDHTVGHQGVALPAGRIQGRAAAPCVRHPPRRGARCRSRSPTAIRGSQRVDAPGRRCRRSTRQRCRGRLAERHRRRPHRCRLRHGVPVWPTTAGQQSQLHRRADRAQRRHHPGLGRRQHLPLLLRRRLPPRRHQRLVPDGHGPHAGHTDTPLRHTAR